MTKVKYTRKIYLDGKLCSKPPSPDKKGQTIIHGETEAAVITPYIALIVREIVKEQPEELEKPITKEVPPVLPKPPVSQQIDIVHGIKEDKFDQIQLQRRKWSGFTFINEGIRRYNEIIYERELVKALNARQKWTSIQKKLVKDSNRELYTGCGPLWFQEPSDKQIVLVTQLGDILKADDEEGIISRTKQFLSELGVVPNISAKDILKGMKESYLDPVNFLLEMHAAVAVRQNKSPCDEKSFSTNERILLTAVCSLHLPFLLLMIHIMLPLSNGKRDINITSDCLDKNVQYCCPYLEPILCRGPTWFDQQIKQQLKRLLLVHKGIPINCDEKLETDSVIEVTADKRFSAIITEPMISYYLNICAEECLKIGSFETLIDGMRKSRKSEKSYSSKSIVNFMYYVKRLPRRTTIESGDESSVITIPDFDKKGVTVPLAQQPVATEKENLNSQGINKDIMQSKVDIEPEINKHSDKQEKGQVNPPPMPLVLNFSRMDYAKVAINSNFKENSCLCTDEQKYELFIQKKPSSVVNCKDVINEVELDGSKTEQGSVKNMQEAIPNSNVKKVKIEGNQDMIEGSKTEQMNVATKQEANKKVSLGQTETDLPNIVQSAIIQEENNVVENNIILPDEEEKSTQDSIPDSDIQKLLDSVEMVPQRLQLQYVLKILASAGDPLAQLPDCHKLASVQRWFELRQGIRTKLTERDNNQLLEASRRMWNISPLSSPIQVPKIKIKKTEERALTWDKRNWLRKKVDEEYTRYLSEVKQQKINNARAFFPTMMTQFYNKSKLNHDFRKCFYTYLPAREADIYVYRPWKLDENKHLGDN